MGHLINRRTREFFDDDIAKIAEAYHSWRNADGSHADVKGFCKSASVAEVAQLGHVLTPGHYIVVLLTNNS